MTPEKTMIGLYWKLHGRSAMINKKVGDEAINVGGDVTEPSRTEFPDTLEF